MRADQKGSIVFAVEQLARALADDDERSVLLAITQLVASFNGDLDPRDRVEQSLHALAEVEAPVDVVEFVERLGERMRGELEGATA